MEQNGPFKDKFWNFEINISMKQNKVGIYSLLTFFLKTYSIKINKVYIDYKKNQYTINWIILTYIKNIQNASFSNKLVKT